MKRRKIEPGCLAMTCHPTNSGPNNGKLVRVHRKIRAGAKLPNGRTLCPSKDGRPPYWLCESLGAAFKGVISDCGPCDVQMVAVQERHLRRIDDPDLPADDVTTDELTTTRGVPVQCPA